MNRLTRNIRGALQQAGFYFPFTWYCILFAAGSVLSYQWLKSEAYLPDTAYGDIFQLLLRIAIWFSAVILVFAFISVLVAFLFFRYKKRKPGIDFSIDTKQQDGKKKQPQVIQLHIHPVLKPLLGFVKLRLLYDEDRYSEKFSLIEKSQRKMISTTIDGNYHWPVPEIKEYRIEKAIIYFEDFFQFFSFAVPLKSNSRFYTQPFEQRSADIQVSPRKTEDTNTRIEELKKVEGEYLSYKNFENNDDVRRIVWKIYARNKELVVRMPEVLDPYASHIYLYPSFFTAIDVEGHEIVEVPFLNYYKNITWTVYRQLVEQGFDVRYLADQDIPQHSFTDAQQLVQYTISSSNWQTGRELKDFVKTKDASMVLVSSLSDAAQVQQLVDQYGNEILFVFVQLTKALKKQHIGDWLQWLFVQQEKDDIAVYKTSWSLSLLRPKLVQNEKKLKKILEGHTQPAAV